MCGSRYQRGSALIVSLLMLLVMTMLGVSAMMDSHLQERMAGHQKQSVAASLAAESGAVLAIQWLETHPEMWGNVEMWKTRGALPSGISSARDGGSGVVYWIESVGFAEGVATIVSRGGVPIGEQVIGQNAVAVVLQDEHYQSAAPRSDSLQAEDKNHDDHLQALSIVSHGDDRVTARSVKGKILAWKPVVGK